MARNEAAKRRQGMSRTPSGKMKPARSASENGAYGRTRPKTDAAVKRAKAKETDPRLIRAQQEQQAAEEKLRRLEAMAATGAHPILRREAEASAALDKDETYVVGEPVSATDEHAAETSLREGGMSEPELRAYLAEAAKKPGAITAVEMESLLADEDEARSVAHETALHVHHWVKAADQMARRWFPERAEVVGESVYIYPEQPSAEALYDARALIEQGYHIARVAERTGVPVTELRRYVGDDGYVR
jgi:hypothetical protein